MPESLRGHFLISAKHLRDPNFFKSVVLMVEHNDTGSMGLVVNRPSGVTVSHALAQHFSLPETEDLVYIGGPVEENALFILHNALDLDHDESPVIPGVYVGSSAEVFADVVRRAAEGEGDVQFRVYSGCAGWSPGQLEAEMDRGDWFVLPATEEVLFHEDPYAVWDETLFEFRKTHPLAPGAEGDPEMN